MTGPKRFAPPDPDFIPDFTTPVPGLTKRQKVLAAAVGALGTPYSYGGGGVAGPGFGTGTGANVKGFDCGTLTRYAYYVGAGKFLAFGSVEQGKEGIRVGRTLADLARAQPGDLVFFDGSDNPNDPYGHVGIFAAHTGTDDFGQTGPLIVHAPYPGQFVRYEVVNPEYLDPVDIRQYCPRDPAGVWPA